MYQLFQKATGIKKIVGMDEKNFYDFYDKCLRIISKRLTYLVSLLLFIFQFHSVAFAQGLNHTFLLGYDIALFDTNVTSTKARLNIDSNNIVVIPETRKMAFVATQGNISDQNGNLMITSNGCWVANANGDTMLNGADLNPGPFTSNWCDQSFGLPLPHGNIILPYPGDSSKYILFHQTANQNLISNELFYSIIDMNLDGGLGGVILKNQFAIHHDIGWGISACKHANGRDWWIVALKNNSNKIYKILLTPAGIDSFTIQTLHVPIAYNNACQPTFSPDGTKFAYSYGYGGPNPFHDVRLFHFDRCTGNFSDTMYIPFYNDGSTGFGLSFSSDSKYLYHCSFQKIYQINTDTTSIDTVAINDGYYSPYPPFQTDFWTMYLAANGKIYISSGNGVIDLHYINYSDSAGLACDVHQHALHLPCFSVRGNVNHPNYYLGPMTGSTCDSLPHVGIGEIINHDFHFSISPNPVTDRYTKIIYLLPQNKPGWFEMNDMHGREVFKELLPPWSSLQYISLPQLPDGIYCAAVISGSYRAIKKIVVMQE
jgi:hypothetical protein